MRKLKSYLMSLFHNDLSKEAILAKFLTKHYSNANLKINRISDKKLQLLGVDLILEGTNGLSYKIDEKAQLHYLNTDLPTFALEIDYLKDGRLMKGWLYNPEKATEAYAFVFSIHLIKGKINLKEEADIDSCEVILISRIRLVLALSMLDLNFGICREHSKQLRKDENENKMEHIRSGFNFQISNQLSERPVNLIVKKTFLEKIGKKYIFKNSSL
jgi:hypothetical protein